MPEGELGFELGLDHSTNSGRGSGNAGPERRAENGQRCRNWESGSETISKIEGRGCPSDCKSSAKLRFQGRRAVIGGCRDLGLRIPSRSSLSRARRQLVAGLSISRRPSLALRHHMASRTLQGTQHLQNTATHSGRSLTLPVMCAPFESQRASDPSGATLSSPNLLSSSENKLARRHD